MEKYCLECGEHLRGRVDKKYCTDFCRNAYNNRLNCNINNYVRNVNFILKKNRRILESMMLSKNPKVPKAMLIELGFNFQYFTHREILGKGAIFNYCYDLGYQHSEKEIVLLVKRHEDIFKKYEFLSAAEPNENYYLKNKDL